MIARENDTDGPLPSEDFQLMTDAFGQLVLTDSHGRQHVGVELIRAFPISYPQGSISVTDTEGREVLWIPELDQLPATLRTTVEQHLAEREFLPSISRVVRISSVAEPSVWEVETDRGPTSFRVTSDTDVRSLGDQRALVTDSEGIRYLIPSLDALDQASRHLLERYL